MARRRRVERRPEARRDLIEQAVHLGEEATEELAIRFLDASDEAFRTLANDPEIGRLRGFSSPRRAGLRSLPVPGFPNHLIFYRVDAELVEIVRILHGARDLTAVLEEDD